MGTTDDGGGEGQEYVREPGMREGGLNASDGDLLFIEQGNGALLI